MSKSQAKEKLETIINQLGVNVIPEYKFHSVRRFRIDYFLPDQNIGIEFEGGAWTKGRHIRPQGFINDCTKYNLATAQGIKIFRFTSEHLKEPEKVRELLNNVLVT